MKIKATPEGREGVWTVEKAAEEYIHNIIPAGGMMLGADWNKESVIDEINKSERIAIMTGDSLRNNLNHSLWVITENKLYLFDIGKITDADIEIAA